MNNIEIQNITDIPTLIHWRTEVLECVFSLPEEYDYTALMQAHTEYFDKHLGAGNHIACQAMFDGNAVGCGNVCFYRELPSPDNPSGYCAYLMNIYVREPFRHKGIATRIVRWLIGKALARNVGKIYLETSDAGRQLYSLLGFDYMKDMMKLSMQ